MIVTGEIIEKRTREGKTFLAVNIEESAASKYLYELRDYLGEVQYELIRKNKILRDGTGFHITIVPPDDMNNLRIKLNNIKVSVTLIGLGGIEDKVFFVVAESNDLDVLRTSNGLSKWDYHVTLGFIKNDIHGKPKDRTTILHIQ